MERRPEALVANAQVGSQQTEIALAASNLSLGRYHAILLAGLRCKTPVSLLIERHDYAPDVHGRPPASPFIAISPNWYFLKPLDEL